jgi:hypothetical protein
MKILLLLIILMLFGCNYAPVKPLIVTKVEYDFRSMSYTVIDGRDATFHYQIPYNDGDEIFKIGDTLK